MDLNAPAIRFGVGTIDVDGQPATAVVVNDQVATLATIVARRSTPGAVAPSMRDFMPHWERWHEWLRGLDLKPSQDLNWQPMSAVNFMAPVLEPNNIFHAYHNYSRPSSLTGKSDPPKAERRLPEIFLGSRSALAGHRAVVHREHGGTQFDFELEMTAVIGKKAVRISADQADRYVAGYTIANDLTMHFGWWKKLRDHSRLFDIIRMKNFPGYTPLGPVIVPKDIVGNPHDLSLRASVDGQLRQDSNTRNMIWSIHELIEYLSWVMPLEPGDLILSGSDAELPPPPGQRRGIPVGRTVVCEIARLGQLENLVVEQSFQQPNEIFSTADQHD